MKKSSRVIAIGLAALLCASAVWMAGCSQKKEENGGTSTGIETTQQLETESKKLLPHLPEKDFGGYELNFLVRSEGFNWYWCSKEIYAEKEIGETLNDAVFARNRYLQEKYNFVIKEYRSDDPIGDANKALRSGDAIYDVFMLNMFENSNLAQQGQIVDLKTVKNIDLSQPWWDQRANASLSIGNKLFWTLGDLNIMDNDSTWATLFNKAVLHNYDLENPYELVRKNQWTIEKMHEMSKVATKDLNGDGKINDEDSVGHLTEISNTYGMFIGAGESIAKKEKNDLPILSMYNERATSVLTNILDFMLDSNATLLADDYTEKYKNPWDECTRPMFMEDRGLFYTIGLGTVKLLRHMTSDFGILPIPKYNGEQSEYYHYVHPWSTSSVSIPVTNTDVDRTGFLLEAIAAESMYTLTPAYYYVTITNKIMRDTDSEEMLSIILGSLAYDFGAVFNWGGTNDIFTELTRKKSYDYASAYTKKETAAKKAIQKTVDAFAKSDK